MKKVFFSSDKAGFNLHISRSRGWSKKRMPVKSIVFTSRGTLATTPGSIFAQEMINIGLKSTMVTSNKKKEKKRKKKRVILF